MRLIKTLLLLAVITTVTFSCKESKKEGVDGEIEAVEETVGTTETVEVTEIEGADGSTEVVEVEEVRESASPAKGVESSSVGLEETVVEGVMVETMADTPVVFPGCAGTIEEIRACSRKMFIKRLKDNYNADRAADLGLKAGEYKLRALVMIDQSGRASVLKVQGPHKDLDKEIGRVIGELPQMKAATEGGQPVSVSFILPLAFSIM